MPTAFQQVMVQLAVEVLDQAAERKDLEAITGAEVRLALRVLAIVLPHRRDLEAFWTAASYPGAHPWQSCQTSLHHIRNELGLDGWDVANDVVPCEGHDMCNRYRMTESREALMRRYGVEPQYANDESYPPGELFPNRPAWVVRTVGPGASWRRSLSTLRWGVPRTIRGAKGQPRVTQVTNVRNLESPFWRSMLTLPGQRCLVPVTSFSEYGPGPKGAKPLFWFDVPSRPIFSFAGIWRGTAEGAVFAFLTCEPNSLVAPVHPKAMPLILHEDDEERWLRGDLDDLVAPFPAQLMSVQQAPDPRAVVGEDEDRGQGDDQRDQPGLDLK